MERVKMARKTAETASEMTVHGAVSVQAQAVSEQAQAVSEQAQAAREHLPGLLSGRGGYPSDGGIVQRAHRLYTCLRHIVFDGGVTVNRRSLSLRTTRLPSFSGECSGVVVQPHKETYHAFSPPTTIAQRTLTSTRPPLSTSPLISYRISRCSGLQFAPKNCFKISPCSFLVGVGRCW